MVPVRFYHGDPADVPERYSSAPDVEKVARQAILRFDDRMREGVILRFAVETNAAGVPMNVTLVEYDEDSQEVLNIFTIPDTSESTGVVAEFPKPQPKPGVILPKPAVQPLHGRAKGQADDDDSSK